MTPKQFYDWQTAGGTDDVMRLVDCLERADIAWCAVGGLAVNHWAERRQSKKIKDLGDIARLVESHPRLWELLDPDLKAIIEKPSAGEHKNA